MENPPSDARSMGVMESNQRHVSFRMKKRGMHWSPEGGEAMVKVKQGILNQTLREVYLKNQTRSARQQREVKQVVRYAKLLKQPTRPSIGVKYGSIGLYTSSSSPIGHLSKTLRYSG